MNFIFNLISSIIRFSFVKKFKMLLNKKFGVLLAFAFPMFNLVSYHTDCRDHVQPYTGFSTLYIHMHLHQNVRVFWVPFFIIFH